MSRKAGEETGDALDLEGGWRVRPRGCFARDTAGTTIRLHLKAVDGDAGVADYCDEWVLRQVVRKYSDFVAYPIRLTILEGAKPSEGDGEGASAEAKTAGESAATELPTRRTLDAPLNSMKAIWTRPESEVEAGEFDEFYKHITHDPSEPDAARRHVASRAPSKPVPCSSSPPARPTTSTTESVSTTASSSTSGASSSWTSVASCCRIGCASCAVSSTRRISRSTSRARCCSRTARSRRFESTS